MLEMDFDTAGLLSALLLAVWVVLCNLLPLSGPQCLSVKWSRSHGPADERGFNKAQKINMEKKKYTVNAGSASRRKFIWRSLRTF